MRTSLETRVRRELARFVTGRIPLHVFNRWFVPATWNVRDSSGSLWELVCGAKEQFDEYDSGHLTREQLKQKLAVR
jgi:hypothetical protein